MKILLEYVDNDILSLKKYLETPDDVKRRIAAQDDSDKLLNFLFFKVRVHPEQIFGTDNLTPLQMLGRLEKERPDIFSLFCDYVIERQGILSGFSPLRGWFLFTPPIDIVKNGWLIHFTASPQKIAEEGFKYGVDNFDDIASSRRSTDEGGKFSYAYMITDFSGYDTDVYGKDAVLFRASGIRAYHDADEEYQVIFKRESAKDIVPIFFEDDKYSVKSKDGKIIKTAKSARELVGWIQDNHMQYKKIISWR
jgi:hypothetical protein